MKDDLERVRQLGHALLVRLQEVTHSVRIGEPVADRPPPCQPLPLRPAATTTLIPTNVLDSEGPPPALSKCLTDLARPQDPDISTERHLSSRSGLEGTVDCSLEPLTSQEG